jgi:hypothetical protein
MAETLKAYKLRECVGDKYAGRWVIEAFAKNGITYRHSSRDRSQVYVDVLPLFMSGRISLLDNQRLVAQFAALERRTTMGRDKIDHPPHMHDDAANAVAGAAVLAADVARVSLAGPIVVSQPFPDLFGVGVGGDSPEFDAVNGISADGGAALMPYERWGG